MDLQSGKERTFTTSEGPLLKPRRASNSSAVLNGFLSPRLAELLTPAELAQISDSVQFVNTLPEATKDVVRQVFCDGYNAQMRVMLYISVAGWLSTMLLWEKKLKRVKDIEGY